MTENTQHPADQAAETADAVAMERYAVDPYSGEVVEFENLATNDLARALRRFEAELARGDEFRRSLRDELVRRLDKGNSRTATIGGFKLETNAPTEVSYRLDVLRDGLNALVAAGKLDADTVERIITTSKPKPPEPRVDKREVNKLTASDDPDVIAAVVKARVKTPASRTLKVEEVDHA